MVVQVNLLSVRVGGTSCCMQEGGAKKGDGVKWHNLQNGFLNAQGRNRAQQHSENDEPLAGKGKNAMYPVSGYASTSAGTTSLSFSAVVCPVASRQRSTARRRAAATAHFRRAAPRATPATSARTGG